MSDEPKQTTEETTAPAQQTTDTQPEQNAGEKTFTQSELERLLDDRLKRDRNAQESKLLETLGIDSVSDLKAFVEAKRKADEDAMSELDKAYARIESAERKAQEAEQKLVQMQQQQIANGRKQAFINAIREKGAKDESRLQILVQAEMPEAFDKIFEDESATVNDKLMDAFIKDVQSTYPLYFGSAGAGSPSTANGISPTSEAQQQRAKDEYRRRLRR